LYVFALFAPHVKWRLSNSQLSFCLHVVRGRVVRKITVG